MRALLAVALLSAGALHAADLALTGATVYTSPVAAPLKDAVVIIRGRNIESIGSRGTVPIPGDAKSLDCSGKFITAGFWNSHVHILQPALLGARDAAAASLNGTVETMLTRWGFTTVFDIGSVLENTLALRRRIESGDVPGPRVLTVGEPLWTAVPVYVRQFLALNRIAMPLVATPEDAAARVKALSRSGVNGIKLFTGSLQAGGMVANMPVSLVRAATAEAHRNHLPVFCHPQNSAGVEAAVECGVDILAHTVPDSPPWSTAFVARLKRAKMALIPTLTLFDSEARKEGASDQSREQWIAKMVAELRAYSSAGGEIIFGTDVGYIDHVDTALEFTLMARAGMSFQQILASLTTAPARRFGFAGRSGRLAPGMDADVVVLGADPAQDITALSRVEWTIRAGTILYSSK